MQPASSESRTGRHVSRSPPSTSTSPNTTRNSKSPFLIALNATDDVDWAEMQIKVRVPTFILKHLEPNRSFFKARGIVNHFAEPLLEFGTRLVPPPPSPRTIPRTADRFY